MIHALLKQSTQVTITVLLVDSADHVTGKTGLAAGLTITASKAGTYSSTPITPTVTELDATNAKGLYSLVLTTTHTNTLGELLLHITASGADPADYWFQVSTYIPGEAATLQADQAVNATKFAGQTITAASGVTLPSSVASPTNITAATGVVLSAAGVQAIWDALTSALTTVGSVGKLIVTDLDAAVSSRMATFTLPTNFSSLVIDSTGRVNAFLIGILTSVFTEGATGRIAAAFKQFFNIATPAATMDHGILVDTVTTLTNAPSDSSGVTTLLSRLSATRAGYLDNLSAGAAALEASVQSVLSKLLKYVQLILRKDSAIATDNATEVTAINANGGSGAGAFDNTTDAQEALRDRGDAAWTTVAAAAIRSAVGLGSANLDTQLASVQADTDDIQTRLPAALTGAGNLKADAQVVSDKTGYALTSAYDPAKTASQAGDAMTLTSGERTTLAGVIWATLTSALTTVGSIGKLLVDNVNATISSRLASASYTVPPTVGAIADQVWEETLTDHSGTSGSTAEALSAAGSAGDPWATALPGAYGAGSAGKIVGDNLNATVSSRAQAGDAMALTSGERNSTADALLDRSDAVETGLTPRGSLRLALAALAGKLSGNGTTTVTIRNVGDTKDRITATIDTNKNRTAVSTDVS